MNSVPEPTPPIRQSASAAWPSGMTKFRPKARSIAATAPLTMRPRDKGALQQWSDVLEPPTTLERPQTEIVPQRERGPISHVSPAVAAKFGRLVISPVSALYV